jgi:chorismate--pyruvate lyase
MRWSARNFKYGSARPWLGAAGSLSARLAQTGTRFEVQVLRQGRLPLRRDEALALGLNRRLSGYVREVLLRVDQVPLVYARSVTDHAHSLGPWRSLRGLGNRPLADVLFGSVSGIVRTPLQFASVRPVSPLQRHIGQVLQRTTGRPTALRSMPARRSVFRSQGAGLLVMEVFVDPTQPWIWPVSR